MKKFLIIIGLFCGFIGDSSAECVLTESTDRTPSDEDLYPQNPYDESRMALVCETGKCEDGEVVFAKAGHYRKNTLVNKDVFYKCNAYSSRARNDRWVAIDIDNHLPACDDDDISGKEWLAESLSGVTLGRKQADNLYTDICWKKFEEKCGVKCTPENNDKDFYCDNGVINCFEGTFSEYASFFRSCEYVDPKTRTDSYIIENKWFDKMSFWGEYILDYGEVVYGDMSICQGCASGLFYGGGGYCYSNLDEAWCYWRKNKENKNTEWKDDHCECLDSGMEWDTEKHDCVKKKGGGKTGGGKTGGKTGSSSGKTGSGSGKTGGGKIGSGSGKIGGGTTSDTKCGVECNKENENKIVYCDDDVFKCNEGVWGELKVYDTQKVCASYRNPITPGIDLNRCKLKRPNTDDYLVCVSEFSSKSPFVDKHNFCWICPPNRYLDERNWLCIDQEQKAWCYVFNENETKWNEADQSCECLGVGMKWNKETHKCVMDTGNKTPQQPENTKINCSFELGAVVRCRDGVQYNKNVSVSVSSATCDMYTSNVAKYVNEIADLLCTERGGVDNVLTDAQVKNAADNLDRFFTNAEANASVWKNAEGKFNTARLASDATAGVILGTVGGIVSANIIKKKQVEKGFDALNCTIGGQKVAGWGDEFTVGLHR